MGYDIEIKLGDDVYEYLYMTFNHTELFKKYSIYPRGFNGMTVVNIIPKYEKAKEILESEGYTGYINTNSSTDYKYNDNILYQRNENVILFVVNDTLDKLYNCPDEAKWYSD